jgi:uncharacterized Zn-finger protein
MKLDIVHVKKSKVECTGTKEASAKESAVTGHPKIYLYVGGKTKCPYCGKVFVLDNTVNASKF